VGHACEKTKAIPFWTQKYLHIYTHRALRPWRSSLVEVRKEVKAGKEVNVNSQPIGQVAGRVIPILDDVITDIDGAEQWTGISDTKERG